tara:strand:- start:3317 stop:3553 length:237 start_codon:yes stop_codon:yes gene_type:complete
LVEGLKRNLVKVVFMKVNGDLREMNCTLHESILPESTITETEKKINLDTISVWDIDNSGWRSFRIDSIKQFKMIEGII